DEPLAILGGTVRGDFEGDQFTFFKPPADELELFFGVDIHEMQPYRPLPQQAAEQIAEGRTIIVELDSFHLPDTAATSYHQEHVKSSAIVESIDVEGQRMRYFHNAGLYELSDDDFRGLFTPGLLPPYTELVRFDAGPPLTGAALRHAAREVLPRHLARRPSTNPSNRLGTQRGAQLPALDGITGWEGSADRSSWGPARVPGTVAGALGEGVDDLDAQDWWFRARVHGAPAGDDEQAVLRFEGLATVADVYLDGDLILQ